MKRLIFVLDAIMGAVWTLAFPPFRILPLFWLGLFYFFARLSKHSTRTSAALTGWFWGWGILWAAFYWLVYTMQSFGSIPIPVGILGTHIYVCFFAIQFALLGFLLWKVFRLSREQPKRFILAATIVLTAVDCLYPEHFPWEASLMLSPFPFWLQTLDIWGSVGVSFCLYLSVVTAWAVWQHWKVLRAHAMMLAIPATIAFVLFVGYGLYARGVWKNVTSTNTVRLAGIQANIGSADKVSASRHHIFDKMDEVVRRYLNLSRSVGVGQTDLIVWPETAFPDYIRHSHRLRDMVSQASRELSTDFLVGGFDLKRTMERSEVYNGIFLFDHATGNLENAYYKYILLAFGEYVPFSRLWPRLKGWFPAVSDFQAGEAPQVLEWRGHRLGITICYEAIIPDFVDQMVEKQPEFFLNITNDSWFGNTREPPFHLALQAMRAIEHRLPMFRLANTGISAVISPYGDMIKSTAYDTEDVMRAEMPILPPHRTFFKSFGFKAGQWLLMAALAWVLWTFFRPGASNRKRIFS